MGLPPLDLPSNTSHRVQVPPGPYNVIAAPADILPGENESSKTVILDRAAEYSLTFDSKNFASGKLEVHNFTGYAFLTFQSGRTIEVANGDSMLDLPLGLYVARVSTYCGVATITLKVSSSRSAEEWKCVVRRRPFYQPPPF
jgi:hypothetical protein